MSTKTATAPLAGEPPSSPPSSAGLLQDFPTISPTLRQHWKTKKSGGSYGCVREVYHPLSPLAEPSASIFYDSDADQEDDGPLSSPSSKAALLHGPKSPLDDVSGRPNHAPPLAPRSRSRNVARSPTQGDPPPHRRTKSDVTSPVATNPSRKRSSQPDVSELFGIHSSLLHMHRAGDKGAKRSRKDLSARRLDYRDGDSSDEYDENDGTSDSSAEPDADAESRSAVRAPKGKERAAPPRTASPPPPASLRDSPKFVSPSPARLQQQPRNSPAHRTPTQARRGRLPATSPRRFPLPESPDGGSGLDSLSSTPSLSLEASPLSRLSPPVAARGFDARGRAAAHAEALASKLEILHIKAQQFSESITRPTADRKLARELDALFSKENRFDPQEAAKLEAEYQHKIRAIYEKRLLEEQRQAEQERQEQQEILRAAEAARHAADEQRRRAEEERRRRERDELERKRKEDEAARARAEQQRQDAEARRQADENARLEKEAKLKAEKDRAAATAAAAAQAAAVAAAAAAAAKAHQDAQAAQAAHPSSSAQPPSAPAPAPAPATAHPPAQAQVFGRRSFETEAANVMRVLTNLTGVRKIDNDSDFFKSTGLKQIRRELMPKLGQLTGSKDQTIAVRESIKALLTQAIKINSPPVEGSKFLFYPPAQDFAVPVAYIWVVNELAKMAVRQINQECTVKADAADPIGVVIAAISADPKYSPGGRSLIDIFIARFLKRNPILLGADGPDATDADRARLGWKKVVSSEGGVATEREDEYIGRIQSYTAGFVALAGRDFRKSAFTNPYPSFNLWHSLASLLNKPAERLTNSHYYVVHTILLIGAKKLCSIYGVQAKKMIEIAVGPWAQQGMQKEYAGAHAVQSVGLFIKKQDWWQ